MYYLTRQSRRAYTELATSDAAVLHTDTDHPAQLQGELFLQDRRTLYLKH